MYRTWILTIVILLLATLVGYVAESLRSTQWQKTRSGFIQISSGVLGIGLAFVFAPGYAAMFPKIDGNNAIIDDLFSAILVIGTIVIVIFAVAIGSLLRDLDAARRARHS